MEKDLLEAVRKNSQGEPYVKLLNIKVVKVEKGHAITQLKVSDKYNNFFSITHGGAIFSLIDVALGTASNSYGNIAVALSMNINYIKSSRPGDMLTAEAVEVSRGRRIATYNIVVKNDSNKVIASCQAVAYIKKEKLPFLK